MSISLVFTCSMGFTTLKNDHGAMGSYKISKKHLNPLRKYLSKFTGITMKFLDCHHTSMYLHCTGIVFKTLLYRVRKTCGAFQNTSDSDFYNDNLKTI